MSIDVHFCFLPILFILQVGPSKAFPGGHNYYQEEHMRQVIIARLPALLISGPVLFILLLSSLTANGEGGGRLLLTSGLDTPFVLAENAGQVYLEVLVNPDTGRLMTGRRLRRPLNIALVIDRSGSMASDHKLENVKRAAQAMVDRLKPGDYFSLISYDTAVKVHIPAQPIGDRFWVRSVISRLFPGGSTNLGGGLEEGYRQVQRYHRSNCINRVILLSDGKANVGITSSQQLADIAMNRAASGVSLSTIGVGLNFNEELMAALSESGNGMYYFIDESARIEEILTAEFHKAEHTVARDIQVHITLEPGVELEKVFANRYKIQGRTVQVFLGDLAEDELRRLQLRLRYSTFLPGRHPVASMTLEYHDIEQEVSVIRRQNIILDAGKEPELVDRQRDREISERSYVFEAHYARSRAALAVDGNDLAAAREILGSMQNHLQSAVIQSEKVQEALKNLNDYNSTLQEPMEPRVRARIQKGVKYRSYTIEGC